MRKFLIHKENGNGPDEIEIDDTNNPYGVLVKVCVSGMIREDSSYYVLDRTELLKYCADTYEEALVIKRQVVQSLKEFHKSKYKLYDKYLATIDSYEHKEK